MKSLDQWLAFAVIVFVTGIWCVGLIVALHWLLN